MCSFSGSSFVFVGAMLPFGLQELSLALLSSASGIFCRSWVFLFLANPACSSFIHPIWMPLALLLFIALVVLLGIYLEFIDSCLRWTLDFARVLGA